MQKVQQRWVGDMGEGGWITELAWSEWTAVDADTCESVRKSGARRDIDAVDREIRSSNIGIQPARR